MRGLLQCSGDCPDLWGGKCLYYSDHHHGVELGVRQTHCRVLSLQALEYLQQNLEDLPQFRRCFERSGVVVGTTDSQSGDLITVFLIAGKSL